MANQPFPWPAWIVAVRDTLRWFLDYEPPAANPGPAVTGEVVVTVKPKEPGDG